MQRIASSANLAIKKHIAKANYLYERELYAEALQEYTCVIDLDPCNDDALIGRSAVYIKQGNYEAALVDVERSMALSRTGAAAYNNRAMIYARQGRYDLSMNDYDIALVINPNNPAIYNNRGSDLFRLGKLDDAISDFNRAIELNKSWGTAYNNRGNSYAKRGDLIPAFADYCYALKLKPTSVLYAKNLAELLYLMTNSELAKISKSDLYCVIKQLPGDLQKDLFRKCLNPETPLGTLFWKAKFKPCTLKNGNLRKINKRLNKLEAKLNGEAIEDGFVMLPKTGEHADAHVVDDAIAEEHEAIDRNYFSL